MAAVRISTVTAEGCHFNGVIVALAFSTIATHGNQHHAELRTHSKSLGKNADDLMRRSRGGHVVVGGFTVQEQVANAAADEISRIAVFTQSMSDADGFNRFVSREIHFVFYRNGRKGREGKQNLTADERG